MSLDVYLVGDEEEEHECRCAECGNKHVRKSRPQRYTSNITHNLNRMAEAAGIYGALWRPDEAGITHARQLIEPLTAGLALLKSDPDRFRKFDAPNGWGRCQDLVRFVGEYLAACREHPDALIEVSR